MDWSVIRAAVHTRDGEAGRICKVILDPVDNLVTHVVVHEGVLFGREVVVPTTCVRRTVGGDVWLALDHDDLAALPDFEASAFESPPAGTPLPIALPYGAVLWPRLPLPRAEPPPGEPIHAGEVPLDRGTPVSCTDGPCGRIERVRIDDVSHHLLGVVVRRGRLFQRLVEVPASWIDHVDGEGVHLRLTRQEVASAGRVEPPAEPDGDGLRPGNCGPGPH